MRRVSSIGAETEPNVQRCRRLIVSAASARASTTAPGAIEKNELLRMRPNGFELAVDLATRLLLT